MLRRNFGSISLIAGTCIGAGMLALPVAMAALGVWHATLLLLCAWAFMLYTGWLVSEVANTLPERTGYITMARRTLGRPGEIFSWVVFLLLLYSLMVAYITGGGALLASSYQAEFGLTISHVTADLPWVFAFAGVIFLGRRWADLVNRFLLIAHLISYILLIVLIIPRLHFSDYQGGSWVGVLGVVPILLASFGYHIIIPSVYEMSAKRMRLVKQSLVLGSISALIVYILWVFAVQGAVPQASMLAILHSGQPTAMLTTALTEATHSHLLGVAVEFFILFGIATSFMGVSLGLYELLFDGFKARTVLPHRLSIAVLTFLPPFIFALSFPKGFLLALGYAGVFVAVLHGILPAMMAKQVKRISPLGWTVVMLCSGIVIYAQIAVNLHWIS